MAVVTTMAVKTIRALIDGLDEDYEAAKKLFLKLWRDAGAVHKWVRRFLQCPFDIPTLDKAAALPMAAATRVTDLRQYINSKLAYSGLKFFVLCTN